MTKITLKPMFNVAAEQTTSNALMTPGDNF